MDQPAGMLSVLGCLTGCGNNPVPTGISAWEASNLSLWQAFSAAVAAHFTGIRRFWADSGRGYAATSSFGSLTRL